MQIFVIQQIIDYLLPISFFDQPPSYVQTSCETLRGVYKSIKPQGPTHFEHTTSTPQTPFKPIERNPLRLVIPPLNRNSEMFACLQADTLKMSFNPFLKIDIMSHNNSQRIHSEPHYMDRPTNQIRDRASAVAKYRLHYQLSRTDIPLHIRLHQSLAPTLESNAVPPGVFGSSCNDAPLTPPPTPPSAPRPYPIPLPPSPTPSPTPPSPAPSPGSTAHLFSSSPCSLLLPPPPPPLTYINKFKPHSNFIMIIKHIVESPPSDTPLTKW
ncbi:hypothetical protein BCR39DRAFT_347240 [Naematelia encephala]|uniref:Uncharacterized protein n=1 Tax=Naematelia encephala TaxID=71784 RepID=A0A1Y2AML3_9TREE|nr:hypothetical protein BCR39DRAFT_347240 [Naematelia encephala]